MRWVIFIYKVRHGKVRYDLRGQKIGLNFIGLSTGHRQAIIRANAGILLIWPLGTNFHETLIEILTLSFKKMHLKVFSAKWWPFCLSLNVWTYQVYYRIYHYTMQAKKYRNKHMFQDFLSFHDDIIKWKHFLRYWPFVRGIHQSPANSLHKGQWHRALVFPLICTWINSWVNNREAGDLRCYRAHQYVIVMSCGLVHVSHPWRLPQLHPGKFPSTSETILTNVDK